MFCQPQRRGNGCLVDVNVRQFLQNKGFALTPAHNHDGQSRVALAHCSRNTEHRLRMRERHHNQASLRQSCGVQCIGAAGIAINHGGSRRSRRCRLLGIRLQQQVGDACQLEGLTEHETELVGTADDDMVA